MSVLSQEDRLVTTTVRLPRVNLLPPEIAERATFQRIQAGLGVAVLAAVGVVGLLYLSASHSVASAQGDLDAANSQASSLQQQSAKYADVTATYARAAAAQATLRTAMGGEIRYSQLLNDLSLTVPSNVWLSSLGYTSTPPVATSATVVAGAPVVATGVGTFTVSATAFSHDDVAVWLESIAGLKAYANPYFSTSTEELLGTRKAVTFTSTAVLTPAALSGRYTDPAGGR